MPSLSCYLNVLSVCFWLIAASGCVSIAHQDGILEAPLPPHEIEGIPLAEYEAIQAGDSGFFAGPLPNDSLVTPEELHDLSMKLSLSAAQIGKLAVISQEKRQQSLGLTQQILKRERLLQKQYKSYKSVDKKRVEKLIFGISYLKAKLRLLHLDTSLKSTRLLSVQQQQSLAQWRQNGVIAF